MDPSDASAMRGARTVRRADLVLGDRLGRGGQGTVHRVAGRRDGVTIALGPGRDIDGWESVYKEYRSEVLPELDPAALAAMVDLQAAAGPYAGDARWLANQTAWPSAVVEEGGSVRGFLMRAVPDRFHFDFRALTSADERRLANFEYLLNDDAYVGGVGLQVSERDRVELLRDLAGTLIRLHRMGIAVGDLSPKNLLFATVPQPECFLIDCDAMRLAGASVLPQAETPDWQLPAAEERATAVGDAYKFALLAIRLFARNQTTTDASALATFSPELGDLARAGLDPDPTRRPTPVQWAEQLGAAVASASTVTTRTVTQAATKITTQQATQTTTKVSTKVAKTSKLRVTAGGSHGWQPPQAGQGQQAGQRRPPVHPSLPVIGAPSAPGAAINRSGVVGTIVGVVILILVIVLAVNQHPNSTPSSTAATATATDTATDTTNDTSTDRPYDTSTTTDDGYTPDYSTTAAAPTTQAEDAVAQAVVGSCFYDYGTSTTPNLVSTSCTTGAFEVVRIFNDTTSLSSCDNVADNDEAVSSPADDLVLCLSYQNSGGDAFHAAQGDCVYGQSGSSSEWDTESCETGNFKVLAVYRGTTDSSKCSSWPHYVQWKDFTVGGDSGLDVLLCMSMNYPDDAGYATQNECLSKTGSNSQPHFTNTGSCSNSNVYVTGRTNKYDDPGFCGNDGATWWQNSDYPALAYTVCWRYR
ncbi:LppU/SCO3897 family protein [Actinospica sp.]|uniref:LppU/SCO3897 family protein n=1 Tax=Actinospica sp. TaxID=1872142 RepID=UPI002C607189|nr:hypothetical protein [Actinospica sp.]HWG25520.1 hypothetical protein [Actinospica sp.]